LAASAPSIEDETIVVAYVPRTPSCSSQSASRTPPVAGSVGRDGDCAAVRVRVVGYDDVRVPFAREREGEVERARLLRVGERDGGEVRVGLLLLRDGRDVGEAGSVEHGENRPRAHSVHRGVHDAQFARPVSNEPGNGVDVGGHDVLAEDGDAVLVQRNRLRRRHRLDRRLDLPVGRRHDLRAVGHVDLVAVVLRRVVRGGDHRAGGRAQVLHGEREDRRRQDARHELRREPGRCEDCRGVAREVVRAVAGVVADDDRLAGPSLSR
jgi:hypothetical protein